jgi:hypothetical protein
VQDPGDIVMYNHYWFSDPLSGTNIAYPVTANGDFFTYSTTPTVTADDGGFFPWGYIFEDTFETIYAGKYKGLTTLNVNASGLSTAYFPILRIYYDFGDGEVYNNSRNVLIDYSKLAIDSFINGYGYGDPKFVTVDHTYQPSDTTFTVTYTAHVQVFNGSLVANNFFIIISSPCCENQGSCPTAKILDRIKIIAIKLIFKRKMIFFQKLVYISLLMESLFFLLFQHYLFIN